MAPQDMGFPSLSFFIVFLYKYYKIFENYKSSSINILSIYEMQMKYNIYRSFILILYTRAVLSLSNLLWVMLAGFSISLSLMMNELMVEVDFICLLSSMHSFVHLIPWCYWSWPMQNSFFSLYLLAVSWASSLRSTFSRQTYWHRWHIDPWTLIFMWDL